MNKELALGRLLILAWAAGNRGWVALGVWRWPEPGMAGLHPSGSQTCPLGWSPLTVRASIPAARTREVWKSLGAGIQELGVPHTRWALAACSGEYLQPQTTLEYGVGGRCGVSVSLCTCSHAAKRLAHSSSLSSHLYPSPMAMLSRVSCAL